MRSYSEDIRIRIVNAYRNKEGSQRQIAHRFDVSFSFVRKLLKRYRDTGSLAPKACVRTHSSKIDRESVDFLLQLIDSDPSLTLSRLCDLLAQERQVQVSRSTMWRLIQKYRPPKPKRSNQPRKKSLLRSTHLQPPNFTHAEKPGWRATQH